MIVIFYFIVSIAMFCAMFTAADILAEHLDNWWKGRLK